MVKTLLHFQWNAKTECILYLLDLLGDRILGVFDSENRQKRRGLMFDTVDVDNLKLRVHTRNPR